MQSNFHIFISYCVTQQSVNFIALAVPSSEIRIIDFADLTKFKRFTEQVIKIVPKVNSGIELYQNLLEELVSCKCEQCMAH